jgi:tetratricopeptide repeat protein 21B
VLSKLIDFYRRSNQLQEAKTSIEAAQNKASNTNDAGLCYCRGLYHKYSRNLPEALVEFNKGTPSPTQPRSPTSTPRTLSST